MAPRAKNIEPLAHYRKGLPTPCTLCTWNMLEHSSYFLCAHFCLLLCSPFPNIRKPGSHPRSRWLLSPAQIFCVVLCHMCVHIFINIHLSTGESESGLEGSEKRDLDVDVPEVHLISSPFSSPSPARALCVPQAAGSACAARVCELWLGVVGPVCGPLPISHIQEGPSKGFQPHPGP